MQQNCYIIRQKRIEDMPAQPCPGSPLTTVTRDASHLSFPHQRPHICSEKFKPQVHRFETRVAQSLLAIFFYSLGQTCHPASTGPSRDFCCQTMNNNTITERVYARIGLLGNPSDSYYGKTISLSLANFFAEVWPEKRGTYYKTIESHFRVPCDVY